MSLPIFILSDFRSGSTMLRFALDAHPEICCPAEIGLAPLCLQLFRTTELLSDRYPGHETDVLQMRLSTTRAIIDGLMESYCIHKQKPRWCDKSPANTESLNVLGRVFPDAQYIVLYRHGLDQVASFLEWEDVESRLEAYLKRRNGHPVTAAIERWCAQTEKLLAFEHGHCGRTHRVYYETLVKNPEQELGAILAFLGASSVEGLWRSAFQSPHDRGPADVKASRATGVDPNRSGRGRNIDLRGVPTELQRSLFQLLTRLKYASVPSVPAAR